MLFIGESDADAQRKVEARAGCDERRRARRSSASPEQVAEQIQELLDVGIEGLTFSMPDVHDLDAVRLAGETIARSWCSPVA